MAAVAAATLFAIWVFPWLFHFYQVYDPVNSLFGPPHSLSGQLLFYDGDGRGYRSLGLPGLKEAPFFALPGTATDVSFSADGRFACYRHGLSLMTKDRLLERESKVVEAPHDAHGVCLSPEGNAIACLSYQRKRHELRLLPGPGPRPIASTWVSLDLAHVKLSWSPDERNLYGATPEGTIVAYDLLQGQTLRLFPGNHPAAGPRGRCLAFFRGTGADCHLVFLDLKNGTEWVIRRAQALSPPVWSPDEAFLAYFETIRGLWTQGPPMVRLRIFDVKARRFSTLLQGRSFAMPERLTWIPKSD